MRRMLFRGKSVLDDEWDYGGACVPFGIGNVYILKIGGNFRQLGCADDDGNIKVGLFEEYTIKPVFPETVGQFSGFEDADGEHIYEGDIVQGRSEYFGHDNFCRGVVFWSEGRFVISFGDSVEVCEKLDDTEELREWHEDVEVIGNIFDEPELLENGGKLKA